MSHRSKKHSVVLNAMKLLWLIVTLVCTAEGHRITANDGSHTVEVLLPPSLSNIGDGILSNLFKSGHWVSSDRSAAPSSPCDDLKAGACTEKRTRRQCPIRCMAQLTIKDEIEETLRSPFESISTAKHKLFAALQSQVEQLVLDAGGSRSDVPAEIQNAIHAASVEVVKGAGRKKTPVGGNLGYPLSVVYSYLLGLTQFIDWLKESSIGQAMEKFPTAAKVLTGLAPIVTKHGYDSPESRAYYESTIAYFGEHTIPLFDLGWIYEYIGSVGTYTLGLGKHYYVKVPPLHKQSLFNKVGNFFTDNEPELNMNFSVRDLPEKKDGTRLRIGLLSDWPTGGPASIHVLKELAKLKPDLVIHLGDTYYAGTIQEQRDFLHDPIRAYLGENVPIYLVPGNHDYYSAGGQGFYQILSEFNYQDASYFTLRGEHFQIIGVDTGILNNQQFDTLLPFLPDDQIAWANAQIAEGQKQGLKTIFMSHHQFFSRTEGIGVANAGFAEALTIPDRFIFRKYSTGKTFDKKAPSLPGALAEDAPPAVNTRLFEQFPAEVRASISAFYWGHEHSTAIFGPYANITRGRLVGNSAIAPTIDTDPYKPSAVTDHSPWGGPPPLLSQEEGHCDSADCKIGKGNLFWDLGFVTLDLMGDECIASHYKIAANTNFEDKGTPVTKWGDAEVYFSEKY